jgi:hypothetical protein
MNRLPRNIPIEATGEGSPQIRTGSGLETRNGQAMEAVALFYGQVKK